MERFDLSRYRLLILAAACATWTAGRAAAEEPAVGGLCENFTLDDHRGRATSLADLRGRRLVVIAFLGTECPLAKLYGPRLAGLHERFAGRGLAIIGVNSNSQDSLSEIAAYARLHELPFPILKDVSNRLADSLGAVRTPEVFLLDRERRVRYRGRIDDQCGVGYIRDEPTRGDLEIAIEELLAGKEVSLPVTEAVGCRIGRLHQPDESSPVTWSDQIARLFQTRCVECHRDGEIAPFALTEYDQAAGWAETILEVVESRRMPPWHASPQPGRFANDRRLAAEEIELIRRWVAAGAPRGDAADVPPPREFTGGWQLPRQPDAIIPMRKAPFRVPAEGTVPYQYFTADPEFTEDKWVTAAQIVPGNRAVVHHVLVFVKTGRSRFGDGEGFLAAYVPGMRAAPYPAGMAKRIPAGAKLYFQVHYTPVGSEQSDLSSLALVFADPREVTHMVVTGSAFTKQIYIPAGADSHTIEATSPAADGDVLLLSMMPHMHLRGKSFRYELLRSDGTKQPLLDVPRYDFNWQTSYRLAEPLPLAAGDAIHCTAVYDNSAGNLVNPNPAELVRFGPRTDDEMMFGYFDAAIPLASPPR